MTISDALFGKFTARVAILPVGVESGDSGMKSNPEAHPLIYHLIYSTSNYFLNFAGGSC